MKTTKKYGEKIDLALSMWVKLARAFSVFNKKTVDQIRTFNLTEPQFGVIECLGHLGTLPIGDLSSKMLMSCGNATVIIDNLEKENLVERIREKSDRRVIKIALTEKGNDLFNKIFLEHAEYVAKLASVLTESEQQMLSILLKKLGHSVREMV
ncbi:MAG: MarR family transcriptional regulator [Candidatus Sericytochromatia bacterium]|nr:MarR family transcriptional regulator [Candidatus Sericytochromatia bacterium]